MANTTQIKKNIKEIIKHLSEKYNIVLKEKSVIDNFTNGLKIHGISEDRKYGIIVCNNKLKDDKIGAGILSSILGKCYLLILSEVKNKILIFTNKEFYDKFLDKYGVYLKDIKVEYYNLNKF
jgi:hypothetical protein